MKEQFNQKEYEKNWRKNIQRKEIYFTKEDWKKIEEYLKKNNTTLKEIILNKIKEN